MVPACLIVEWFRSNVNAKVFNETKKVNVDNIMFIHGDSELNKAVNPEPC